MKVDASVVFESVSCQMDQLIRMLYSLSRGGLWGVRERSDLTGAIALAPGRSKVANERYENSTSIWTAVDRVRAGTILVMLPTRAYICTIEYKRIIL